MQMDGPSFLAESVADERSIGEYAEALKRHWLLLLLPAVCGAALTVAVVLSLPSVYRSAGKILVESPQIPEAFVASTVTSYVEERIQVIREVLMTRPNLLAIIEKFGLHGGGRDRSASELVDSVRDAIEIGGVAGAQAGGSRTVTFTIGYVHTNPRVAQAVANDLVTTFLNENARNRTERAAETRAFLGQEADRLNARLDQIETEIAAYRTRYAGLLQQGGQIAARRASLGDTLRGLYQQIRMLEDRRAEISIQVERLARVSREDGMLAAQLQEAQLRLREARSRFTDDHPDVHFLQRQVESIAADIAAAEAGRKGTVRTPAELQIDPAYVQLQVELRSINGQVALLNEQKAALEEDLKGLESARDQVPTVDKGLVALERDYQNTLAKYRDLKAKEMQAQLAENLETERMAERFRLIDPPVLPDSPIQPKRGLLIAMGAGLSMFLGLGLVVLAELLDKGIRRTRQIRTLIGEDIPVIAVPYIASGRDALWSATKAATASAALVSVLAASGYVVHTKYERLDVLWQTLSQKVESRIEKLPVFRT